MRQEFDNVLPGFPITIHSARNVRRALSGPGTFQFQRATDSMLTMWETIAEHTVAVDITQQLPAGSYRWNCTSVPASMVVGTLEG